ncbi:MAG: tripartite tricarboxylate transporter TctB family protein [Spirochaetales bacterium]|nr:tripartite tricarboxylate transporter TctB family protein [Spirochaetales bacterium]
MRSTQIKIFSTFTHLIQKIDNTIDHTARHLENREFRIYPTIAGSVFFLALSALILILMPYQIKVRADQTITAQTFPSILAFIMMGGALLNLIKTGLQKYRKEPLEYVEVYILTEIKALILLLFLIIYSLLMPVLGFMLSSVIYGILMLFYFRVKNWKYYLLVTTLAILIGFLFKDILHVRLP